VVWLVVEQAASRERLSREMAVRIFIVGQVKCADASIITIIGELKARTFSA
jgi:hypothetical protein